MPQGSSAVRPTNGLFLPPSRLCCPERPRLTIYDGQCQTFHRHLG